MFRCPNCGNTLHWRPRHSEDFMCPMCSSRLRIRVSRGLGPFSLFFLLVWLLALPLNWGFGLFWLFILFCCFPAMRMKVEVVKPNSTTVPQTSSVRNDQTRSATTLMRQSTVNRQPLLTKGQLASRFCSYCGAAVSVPDWKFCQNCGASLLTVTGEAPYSNEQNKVRGDGHASRCMVCGLNLSNDSLLAYCPHCGNSAHRTHLLEWLHVKKYCPICGQHLTEQELL